ncbi:MAG: SDR family NAD(P)-dependent oxidoreductase [Gammaproteobacteria bacterium]|nr:SDR family NAD(P)-dependent oxidoreductase [Gammaproteobacteria bacterium]
MFGDAHSAGTIQPGRKVAIVTGAVAGSARAIALGFAAAGADIVVTSRSLAACEDVAREIESLGRQALAVACDVADWQQLEQLVETVYRKFGRCDVLVNNAGVTQLMTPSPGPARRCSIKSWREHPWPHASGSPGSRAHGQVRRWHDRQYRHHGRIALIRPYCSVHLEQGRHGRADAQHG